MATERAASDERFHLVARATADAIWDWNLHDDSMWWNEGMQTLFGVPMQTLPHDSTSWTMRLHPEDSDAVLESIHAAIEGTAKHWAEEYRFRRYDGSYAWVQDRGFVIRDAEGRAIRMVGGMTDISAQRTAPCRPRTKPAPTPNWCACSRRSRRSNCPWTRCCAWWPAPRWNWPMPAARWW